MFFSIIKAGKRAEKELHLTNTEDDLIINKSVHVLLCFIYACIDSLIFTAVIYIILFV